MKTAKDMATKSSDKREKGKNGNKTARKCLKICKIAEKVVTLQSLFGVTAVVLGRRVARPCCVGTTNNFKFYTTNGFD